MKNNTLEIGINLFSNDMGPMGEKYIIRLYCPEEAICQFLFFSYQ